jgi:hypothetical protein
LGSWNDNFNLHSSPAHTTQSLCSSLCEQLSWWPNLSQNPLNPFADIIDLITWKFMHDNYQSLNDQWSRKETTYTTWVNEAHSFEFWLWHQSKVRWQRNHGNFTWIKCKPRDWANHTLQFIVLTTGPGLPKSVGELNRIILEQGHCIATKHPYDGASSQHYHLSMANCSAYPVQNKSLNEQDPRRKVL